MLVGSCDDIKDNILPLSYLVLKAGDLSKGLSLCQDYFYMACEKRFSLQEVNDDQKATSNHLTDAPSAK